MGKAALKSGKEVTPGQDSSSGVPRTLLMFGLKTVRNKMNEIQRFSIDNFDGNLNILNNSSISESPGNSGRMFTISAKIQPTDHTSAGVE